MAVVGVADPRSFSTVTARLFNYVLRSIDAVPFRAFMQRTLGN